MGTPTSGYEPGAEKSGAPSAHAVFQHHETREPLTPLASSAGGVSAGNGCDVGGASAAQPGRTSARTTAYHRTLDTVAPACVWAGSPARSASSRGHPPKKRCAKLGESQTITCGGTECLLITLSKPSFATLYPDPDGYYADEPEVAGNVFVQIFVEYKALSSAASYNPYDWSLFADGRAVDHPAFTIHGPQPELGSGQLPTGRTAWGWLVYEVPAAGELILSFTPNYQGPPVFEVVIPRG
jgi:hypothetical protein